MVTNCDKRFQWFTFRYFCHSYKSWKWRFSCQEGVVSREHLQPTYLDLHSFLSCVSLRLLLFITFNRMSALTVRNVWIQEWTLPAHTLFHFFCFLSVVDVTESFTLAALQVQTEIYQLRPDGVKCAADICRPVVDKQTDFNDPLTFCWAVRLTFSDKVPMLDQWNGVKACRDTHSSLVSKRP